MRHGSATAGLDERSLALRRSIAGGECACPMANASYANMLLHPPTLRRVVWDVLKPSPKA